MRRRTALLALLAWVVAAPGLLAQGATTTFTHDANGNLTSKTENGVVWTYVYDARNLLREVQRDGTLLESYQYDYQGHRIKKAGPDGVVRYVWDGNNILLETDDHGNTIAKYDYAGDRLLAVHHVTEGTAFYLLDALGSPVALIRQDGAVAARYKLDAWGVLRVEQGSTPNPFRFTGHQFDEATGLYYAKARYYNPETARFLTEDPVKGNILDPLTLNPYLYGHANPTVYVDPDGRCVGKVQQTPFCQAIANWMARQIGGDPEAIVEREVERREKVVQGRREFRADVGREPRPDEVVWSEGARGLTSDFKEVDMSGRTEPDHAEWMVVGAGVSTRMAVNAARAAGASTAEQVLAGATQLGDEGVSQLTGVSPRDVADLARLAKRGLAPRPPPGAGSSGVTVIGESASGPGVDLLPEGSIGRTTDDLLQDALPISGPGSPAHKATRWQEYQDRGGDWSYQRWSNVYEQNIAQALRAHAAVDAYHETLGWGRREVTLDVEGIPRRLDIADKATFRGREVKTGAQYATQENLWEIQRDQILRDKGWDIQWHFEGTVSKPLRDALNKAGIPYTGGNP
jgi:RHS repeat-associated protein